MRPLSALDGSLSQRFVNATDSPGEPDWDAVERRARQLMSSKRRRHRRSRVLAAALGVAAIAAASPALGLDRAVIDFLRAEPAPEMVRVDFGHWFNEISPQQLHPGAVTTEARNVYTFTAESGNYVLYMSPASDGYCWELRRVAGACENSDSEVIGPLWGDIPRPGDRSPEPVLITGPINDDHAERLVLSFQDGERTDLPFIFVSEPIGAGFFYYEVPRANWGRRLRPSKLTVYGPGDRVLGEAVLLYNEGR